MTNRTEELRVPGALRAALGSLPRKLAGIALPVPRDARSLLQARWSELEASLKTPGQVLGRQLVHCGYLLGPSYCSFSCTHCYLPPDANRMPLPTFEELAEQMRATRDQVGPGGSVQITGGDVVDAYVRAGRSGELVALSRLAHALGLNPMLMTHGQSLLDHPDLLARLVVRGGLRRVSFHVDSTQAGRPGFPRTRVRHEADLHPVREALVRLVLDLRQKTGKPLSAAMTLTVTRKNLDDIPCVMRWLIDHPERTKVFRTISLQPEARVGRSRTGSSTADPDQAWRAAGEGLGVELSRGALQVGHPSCTRMATLLLRYPGPEADELLPDDVALHADLDRVLEALGGAKGQGYDLAESLLRKASALARRPRATVAALRLARTIARRHGGAPALARCMLAGRASALNLIMHTFMDAEEVSGKRSAEVEARLAACAFRGALRREGVWTAVPMCEMNADERPKQARTRAER